MQDQRNLNRILERIKCLCAYLCLMAIETQDTACKQNLRRRRWVYKVLPLLALMGVCSLWVAYERLNFSTYEYCHHCGTEKTSVYIFDRQVSQELHPTLLSKSVTINELISEHQHEWMLVHGCSHDVCMLGKWRDAAYALNDEEFTETLDRIHLLLGQVESTRVLETVMTNQSGYNLARHFSLPPYPPMSDGSFKFWYHQTWPSLDRYKKRLKLTLFQSSGFQREAK
jgi:hypothetical protein